MEKIKYSLETNYEFRNIYDSSVEFKGVEIKSFQSLTGYKSFNRKQFPHGLIDNLQKRMIDSSEKILLNQIESLCPENWPRRGVWGGQRLARCACSMAQR
jgi:hypothetical protein